jgi:UDP-N-acetyl-D-mannosaminuronic acid dehydrogenase
MPTVLNLQSEEVATNEKRSNYIVSVVGCGQRGIFYASAFAEAGFKVICSDADPSVIKRVAKGKTSSSQSKAESKLKSHITKGQISTTGELKKAVSQSDIIVITVATKLDEQKKPNYSQIVNTCKQVGAALHQGTLVIYGGIAGLGFVESTVKETLENTSGLKAGQGFGLAYNPILDADISSPNLELSVAAADKTSLEAAATILKTITKNVKPISDVKTAEAAMLFTVTKQDANTALANELAIFCEQASVDYFEVSKLLQLEDSSFCPSIVEEDNKNEAYLLLDSAENLNVKLKLPTLARQINEDMVKHAVNLTQNALRDCGKTLRRARVAVLGAANSASALDVFVKMLELKGGKVTVYYPNSRKETLDSRVVKSSLNEAVEGADCIVVLSGQEQFNHLNFKKFRALMKTPSAIVDLVGKFEPQQVETEGFIYRRLGRGTG